MQQREGNSSHCKKKSTESHLPYLSYKTNVLICRHRNNKSYPEGTGGNQQQRKDRETKRVYKRRTELLLDPKATSERGQTPETRIYSPCLTLSHNGSISKGCLPLPHITMPTSIE